MFTSMRTWRNPLSLVLVSAVCLFIASKPLAAGIIDNGTLTRDIEGGLDWLDLTVTRGFPSLGVEFDPTLGGQYPGFRVATTADAESLFAAVGLAPGVTLSPAAFTPADTLLTFMGTLFEDQFGRWHESLLRTGTPWPSNPSRRVTYQVRTDFFPPSGSIIVRQFGTQQSQTLATALVRPVPNGRPSQAIGASEIDPTTGALSFLGVSGDGAWFDASSVLGGGLQFASLDGAQFTHVALPSTFSDADDLYTVHDPQLGEVQLAPGAVHVLTQPTSKLRLSGIDIESPLIGNPLVAAGMAPLPVYLQFDLASANFTASGDIPEPSTAVLTASAVSLLVVRRLRGRSR